MRRALLAAALSGAAALTQAAGFTLTSPDVTGLKADAGAVGGANRPTAKYGRSRK